MLKKELGLFFLDKTLLEGTTVLQKISCQKETRGHNKNSVIWTWESTIFNSLFFCNGRRIRTIDLLECYFRLLSWKWLWWWATFYLWWMCFFILWTIRIIMERIWIPFKNSQEATWMWWYHVMAKTIVLLKLQFTVHDKIFNYNGGKIWYGKKRNKWAFNSVMVATAETELVHDENLSMCYHGKV